MKAGKHFLFFQKPDPDFSPSIPPVRTPEHQPAVPPAHHPPGKEADDEELPVPPVFPTA
jgi:hypothetical protein